MIARLLLLTAFVGRLTLGASAATGENDISELPLPITAENFSALQDVSPFNRTLNLSDSLILTGLAKIGHQMVATIMNKETKETFVVSEQPNSQGWKMTAFSEDSDLEKVTATISLAGEEIVKIRYDQTRLKPGESKPGAGTNSSSAAPRSRREREEIRARVQLFNYIKQKRRQLGDLNMDGEINLFQDALKKFGG